MKIIKINLILLFCLLFVIDITLWIFFPIPNFRAEINKNSYIPSSFEANQVFNFTSNEGLYDIDSNIVFSTNNFGFRGDDIKNPKEEGEFRIFLVGGSTTENLYIDDSKSLEKRIENQLLLAGGKQKITVYNAGKSGDISTDHLSMISHRINHLEADLIVLFCGINDFRRSISSYNYIQMPKMKTLSNSEKLKNTLNSFSQIIRRVLMVKNNISSDSEKITFSTRYQKLFNKTKGLQEIPLNKKYTTKFYENNLRSIVGICKTNNIELILMTQPTTWGSQESDEIMQCHWMTIANDKEKYLEDDLIIGLNHFNNITRKISKENNLKLVDLDSIMIKSEANFFDDCHFNNGGVIKSSKIISKVILSNKTVLL